MAVALKNFFQLENPSKTAILGDMFELGDESNSEHKTIVNLIADASNIKTYFVGKYFYYNKINKQNLYFYESYESFIEDFKEVHPENTIILIKGSRGMALERVLDFI